MLRSAAQAIVFVAVSVVASSPASANLIVNGSFEAPDIPTGTFNVFPIIPGMWITYDGSGIEIQDNVAGSPCAGCGDQFVELDSFTSSAMYQEFATSVGQSYQVDFAYSPRPGRTEPDNVINVTWFGSSWHFLGTVSASGEGLLDTQWSSHSFDFIAETPASFLLFFDGGLPSFYSGILGGGGLQCRLQQQLRRLHRRRLRRGGGARARERDASRRRARRARGVRSAPSSLVAFTSIEMSGA